MTSKYIWSEDNIPQIDVHSTKKHDVLREYLKQYIFIVGGHPFQRSSLSITFVDAFSGGGIYEKPGGGIYYGSPLIFLESTNEAASYLSGRKNFKLNAHYIFLDKQKTYLDFLKNVLIERGYKSQFDQTIFFRNGIFEQHVDDIINHIYKRKGTARRCIFLLDQYGYTDVPLHSIYKIFSRLPKSEIILTFYVDFLIDYLCNSESCKKSLQQTGINFDLGRLDDIKSQKQWRTIIQRDLYVNLIAKSGAKYFTNFFIKSNDSHKSYWLLHLSMHPKARNEMQKLHWELKNHFSHEGKAGLYMLGYDPKNDGFEHKQDFLFSDHDQVVNHNALISDLPVHIPKMGVSFNNLFLEQCNFTPSTKEMIGEAVSELYTEREIRILTKNGRSKKPWAKINDDDIIKRQNQIFLFQDHK